MWWLLRFSKSHKGSGDNGPDNPHETASEKISSRDVQGHHREKPTSRSHSRASDGDHRNPADSQILSNNFKIPWTGSIMDVSEEEDAKTLTWRRKLGSGPPELPPLPPKLSRKAVKSYSHYRSKDLNFSSDSSGLETRRKRANRGLYSSGGSSASSSTYSATGDESSKTDDRKPPRRKKTPVYRNGLRKPDSLLVDYSSSSSSSSENEDIGHQFSGVTPRTSIPYWGRDGSPQNPPRPSHTHGRKPGNRTSRRSTHSRSSDQDSGSAPPGALIHLLYERKKSSNSPNGSHLYEPMSTGEIRNMTIDNLDNKCKDLIKRSHHKDRLPSDFKDHAISTLLEWLKAADLLYTAIEKRKLPLDDDMRNFFKEARKVDIAISLNSRGGNSNEKLITKYKSNVDDLVKLRLKAHLLSKSENFNGVLWDLSDEKHEFYEFLWTWNCVARYADATRLLETSENLWPRGRTIESISDAEEEVKHESNKSIMKPAGKRKGAHGNRVGFGD
ncbi:hypothetical protein ACMFMG_009881 [Clarireedia jacksonii]